MAAACGLKALTWGSLRIVRIRLTPPPDGINGRDSRVLLLIARDGDYENAIASVFEEARERNRQDANRDNKIELTRKRYHGVN